ncbi:hypothetical protein ACP4OV_022868 [Aristida adscensionis]
MMASAARKEPGPGGELRALAARAVTDSLRAAAAARAGGAAERAARFEECVRSLEAERAKMEVFRRELPISVHLVGDVIEWLKEELAAQRRRPSPEAFAPAAPQAPAKRKAAEADANDKRSWMSSAQLWSCGSPDDSTGNSNGGGGAAAAAKKPAHKVCMPSNGLPLPTFTRSSEDAGKATGMPVPDLSLSSPAMAAAAACPVAAAPSANSSAVTAVTDAAGAQRQQQAQRKARRCWSPELHRRFVAALQRLGGAQVATPKQIRELMKVDGLTNDEVKSHLQKYRLHTRRASSDGGDPQAMALWSSPEQQYTTSQHSTSQSGSPQGPLQLTVSSRAVSVTAGDSCDGEEEEEEDGKSESYSFEMQRGTRATSS